MEFVPRNACRQVSTGDLDLGDGHPVYFVAEIGINHNGSLEIARQLVDAAAKAGCDAVKFQKRTPELCVPRDQWDLERDTPWGRMTYIEYRHRVEFGLAEYAEIDRHCRRAGIDWFASCWDEPSVDFIEQFGPRLYKAASASLTDHRLLRRMKATGKPLIISTGMSTMGEIEDAARAIGLPGLLIAHSTSTYPCPPEELNLRMIRTLRQRFPFTVVGYSGHEPGLAPTLAAVALGASFVERHVTLDRAMWGSDQAASVEVTGLERLVRDIRTLEAAFGDGVKKVYAGELASRKKLRLVAADPVPDAEALCS
jgi:N-acetylneuraminate synthase